MDEQTSVKAKSIGRWYCRLLAARDDQIGDEDLHGLAVLVQGRRPHLDQPLVRAGLRRPYLQDFALDAQLVPGPHRQRPTQLLEARADDTARGLEIALDHQPPRQRSRVPAARVP